MDKNTPDVAIVQPTPPDSSEIDLLAHLQSLLERRDAALAQPLLRNPVPLPPPEPVRRMRTARHRQ